MASSMGAGELIVIEVVTGPEEIPSNRVSMSANVSIADAALPDLAERQRVIGVAPHQGRQVEGHGQARRRQRQQARDSAGSCSAAVPKPANWRIVQSLPR